MQIKLILKDDWYKTAEPEQMRIALMHVEQEAMDKMNNQLNERYRECRDEVFESCSTDCGWNVDK